MSIFYLLKADFKFRRVLGRVETHASEGGVLAKRLEAKTLHAERGGQQAEGRARFRFPCNFFWYGVKKGICIVIFTENDAYHNSGTRGASLGTPVVPFFLLYFGVSLVKLIIGKKGTLITNGLLGNLVAGQPGPFYSEFLKITFVPYGLT